MTPNHRDEPVWLGLPVAACGSCGAPVVWALHVRTLKPAPIDAEPSADGNCVLHATGRYAIVPGDVLEGMRRNLIPLHTNHFATCPNAEKHRRPA